MARARLTAFVGLNSTAFRRGLRAMRRRWRTFKTTVMGPMVRFGRVIGRTFMRAGLLIGAALVGAIKHASDFRRQMAEVNTMLQGEDLKQFSDGIIKMSGRFGMAKDTLAKGLYDILSAGVAASEGMGFLEVATRAAIGGVTDTATSVDALTTVMNAYGMAAKEVGHVSDVMFQIVKDGKITYTELAESIGKLAPTAKSAGVSLENMAAAVATLVKVEKPARAMTALRAAMFKAAESGQTLFELVEKFKGKSLEEIIKGGVTRRAAQAVAILANNWGTLNTEVEKFKDVGGRAAAAFEKMDKVRHWQRLWQTVLGIVTRVGVVLDKVLAPAINYLSRVLNNLAETPGFKKFLERVQTVTKTITGALIALARGGEGRAMALKGLKLVLIGAFEIAARKAGAFLLKVAPLIGRLISAGFFHALQGPFKKFMDVRTARDIAQGMLERGEITEEQVPAETQKVLDIFRRGDLQKKIDRIVKQFGVELGPAANNLELGFELLEKAAEQATIDLIEFDEGLKKSETAPGAVPVKAAVAEEKKEADRGFTEFRRIGGRIMGGVGVGGRADVGQKTRLQIYRETQEMNKWLKSLDKRMEKVFGVPWEDVEAGASLF